MLPCNWSRKKCTLVSFLLVQLVTWAGPRTTPNLEKPLSSSIGFAKINDLFIPFARGRRWVAISSDFLSWLIISHILYFYCKKLYFQFCQTIVIGLQNLFYSFKNILFKPSFCSAPQSATRLRKPISHDSKPSLWITWSFHLCRVGHSIVQCPEQALSVVSVALTSDVQFSVH